MDSTDVNIHAPAKIVFVNESGEKVKLVHTSACNDDSTCAYQGKQSYWKTEPPHAGTEIGPGASLDVGVLDQVAYWDSPCWIYVAYLDTSGVTLQVFADMKGPTLPKRGIWIRIGAYDTKSTESTPMPSGWRMELVSYDLSTNPTSNKVYIPPAQSWAFVKAPPVAASADSNALAADILNIVLSTAITACFVIPSPLSPLAGAAAAISTAGKTAISLTALQGVIGLFNSGSGKQQVAAAFGPAQAYSASRLALEEWTKNSLRLQMEVAQSFYQNAVGGMNVKMKSIATRVDKLIEASQDSPAGGSISFDAGLEADIESCMVFFHGITNADGGFRSAIYECLDTKTGSPGASGALEHAPPDKVKFALGLAGMSMTLNAYFNGCLLRSFILATVAGSDRSVIDRFHLAREFEPEAIRDFFYALVTATLCQSSSDRLN
jgi:hypothetical protein